MTDLLTLQDAAWGDPDALVMLAKRALAAETLGHADRVVGTVEGLTFARLAAAQGNAVGMGLAVALNAQLADLLDDASLPDRADDCRGEALALADIAADRIEGDPSLGEAIGALLTGIEKAGPGAAEAANKYRRFWGDQVG